MGEFQTLKSEREREHKEEVQYGPISFKSIGIKTLNKALAQINMYFYEIHNI